MKYLGPFLRMNSLNKYNISNQLFHFAKESTKHITLKSKIGITSKMKNSNKKKSSHKNISIKYNFYPLLCTYRKADSKLDFNGDTLVWNEEKFKKDIQIYSNAFMTLSILELCNYYKLFKNIDDEKFAFYKLFLNSAEKQLSFYASHLRNEEGVFVDKKDCTDDLSDELILKSSEDGFSFSNQALLMAAYYKYYTLSNDKIGEDFKVFSCDILNMLIQFKQQLYLLPLEELNKTCFALNMFYEDSKNEKAKILLLDLCELLVEKYMTCDFNDLKKPFISEFLTYLNCILFEKNTNILKFHDFSDNIFYKLSKLYNNNLGIFIKNTDKNKVKLYSEEIICYLLCMLIHCTSNDINDYNEIIYNVFKYELINCRTALSWPSPPDMDDVERYNNFSKRSCDLLEEQNFIMPNMGTPKSTGFAPTLCKNITFNKKKEVFKQGRTSFYSGPNMFSFFIIIYAYPRFLKDFKAIENNIKTNGCLKDTTDKNPNRSSSIDLKKDSTDNSTKENLNFDDIDIKSENYISNNINLNTEYFKNNPIASSNKYNYNKKNKKNNSKKNKKK